ncbi:hypothetical protein [Nitrosopumilus sp.]|uniref:hypothetical protein n=1 Tax=Nitrosopumilus sp. TaxID=2024843 RepID=UPI00292EF7A3|nr:hypothetical protein [Nitrosopumilus sp.]
MNDNYKNAIYAVSSVATILPSIFLISDYMYFQEPLSRVAIHDEPTCDEKCVNNITNDKYRCAEINSDEFVCRRARGDVHNEDQYRNVKFHSAGPSQYGEIVDIPQGKTDERFFNIENMKILDLESKIIQIDFNDSRDKDAESNVIYTTQLKSGDTFVSHCVDDRRSTHLVKYMDLYEYQNKTYAEFWGVHPFTPPELFPCDLPKIIENSLKTDYALDLPAYEEFGFNGMVSEERVLDKTEEFNTPYGKINPEKDIPIFFEIMLMEQNITWEMPQRTWNNPDFELEPSVRICSQIIVDDTDVFLSTVLESWYSVSDMEFHEELPDDCKKVIPVAEIGKK